MPDTFYCFIDAEECALPADHILIEITNQILTIR